MDSGGIRIHVVEDGRQDGRPVVFLHGFPEFWWSWRHQIRAVAATGRRAIAIDLRGFGDSDAPSRVEDYALQHSLGDVAAVLETLGSRAVLVSHDWGGALGWACGALMGDRIDGLVVMNAPHPSAFRDMPHHLPQMQASWYMFFFQFVGVAEEVLARDDFALFRRWFYDTARVPIPKEDVDTLVASFARPGRLTAGLNWYRANVPPARLLAPAAQAATLPAVDIPTMLLWGVDDAYLTFELGSRAGEFVSGPFAFHALADTGHWIQQERPDVVNEHLLAFLDGL